MLLDRLRGKPRSLGRGQERGRLRRPPDFNEVFSAVQCTAE